MLEEKVRICEYRTSQSPLDRKKRLSYDRVRKEVERSSGSSEVHVKRLEKIKTSMRNSRVKFSNILNFQEY